MKGLLLAMLVSLHASDKAQSTTEEAPKSDSYVHVTLISDAVAMGFGTAFLVGIKHQTNASTVPGAIGFSITSVFAPPVIHLLHNQKARAGWSLLLRVITGTVGVLLGSRLGDSLSDRSGEWGGLEGSFVGAGAGAMVGIAIAGVLDAALLPRW